jgi:predicted CxxxxCH...CXXCH cytochrome family protein
MRLSTVLFKTISVSLTLAALFACSNSKSDTASSSLIDSTTGKHVVSPGFTTWRQQHWLVYQQLNGGSSDPSDQTVCSQCHGPLLDGGIAKVSCFSTSLNGLTCHNSEGTFGHPSSWAVPTSPNFHAAKNTTYNGSLVQGSATLAADCGICHATAPGTVSLGSAPSCLSTDPQFAIACHSSNPATAATSIGCVSCHTGPPTGPTGSTAPNVLGDHTVNDVANILPAGQLLHREGHVAKFGLGCQACHYGGSSHSSRHANRNKPVFVNLSGGYVAKGTVVPSTGPFNGGVCSAVSCHGGLQSPDWTNGSINVNTDCESCHIGTGNTQVLGTRQSPQYNSFYSGRIQLGSSVFNLHELHRQSQVLPQPIRCFNCHSVAKLAANGASLHFKNLATHNFLGGDPVTSIGGADTLLADGAFTLTLSPNYLVTPSNISCSVTACHGSATPLNWLN